jgi:hypothetical protein
MLGLNLRSRIRIRNSNREFRSSIPARGHIAAPDGQRPRMSSSGFFKEFFTLRSERC